ncbi:hypothetical protein JTE90_021746 [Oedothorax gibbosus]|uniref:Phage protein n=1 Tax=Oedothorax gibbosus TaxID=931172 RepID=A0AAV6UDX4_9ARAC|nr:hypothetical protein JTE90_021746 [Oedothorax gibbosus]
MKCLLQYDVEVIKNMEFPVNVGSEAVKLQKEDFKKRQKDSHYDSLVIEFRKFDSYPYPEIDEEIMVLGSQRLTELRDKIICISDEAFPGDYSEHLIFRLKFDAS